MHVTPPPLSKYYLCCHCQHTLSVTQEIIGDGNGWRVAAPYRYQWPTSEWIRTVQQSSFDAAEASQKHSWEKMEKVLSLSQICWISLPVSMSESAYFLSSKINAVGFSSWSALTHIPLHLCLSEVKRCTFKRGLITKIVQKNILGNYGQAVIISVNSSIEI